MLDRTNIPGSAGCGEWEEQLTDALDGLLNAEDEARFAAHKAGCPACASLYEEARTGREWLEFLSPGPEAPEGLLEKILAKTGPEHAGNTIGIPMPVVAGAGKVPAFIPPVWQQPGFFARMRMNMQPRLLMTAAMAFFSVALTLNMTGVRLQNVHVTALRMADLRPQALRSYMERQLTMASVPIVRYYDHLRFVYEVESTVREFREENEDNAAPQPKEGQPETRDRKPGSKENREQAAPADRNSEVGGVLESSLTLKGNFARSGGPAVRRCERNTQWIA